VLLGVCAIRSVCLKRECVLLGVCAIRSVCLKRVFKRESVCVHLWLSVRERKSEMMWSARNTSETTHSNLTSKMVFAKKNKM
jgi:hypothetical protein